MGKYSWEDRGQWTGPEWYPNLRPPESFWRHGWRMIGRGRGLLLIAVAALLVWVIVSLILVLQ